MCVLGYVHYQTTRRTVRDKRSGLAIFSWETGLQFLTLFSLVIAIILFGFTSILEGKELSALPGELGGLHFLDELVARPQTDPRRSTGELAVLPSLLLLILTVVPWYFRPADRKISSVNQ